MQIHVQGSGIICPAKILNFLEYEAYHTKNIYTSSKFTVIFIKNHKSN